MLYELLVVALSLYFFFLMIRRPPRSTLDRSSAASDVYKRQAILGDLLGISPFEHGLIIVEGQRAADWVIAAVEVGRLEDVVGPVSYTHLRAHETVLDLVCRLLLEKKKKKTQQARVQLSKIKKVSYTILT